MRPQLIFIICIDADPDSPAHGGIRYDCLERLSWKHLPELVSEITVLRKEIQTRFGKTLRVSWFLRADIQIEVVYGDAAWGLREFGSLWEELSRGGDELAWHPHAWRWSDPSKCWYNETSDTSYILENYERGFEAFKQGMGFPPAACRAGINFHNNQTMAKLEKLGVKVDLSAHAGLKLSYTCPHLGCPIREGFDWSGTTSEPYYPSRDDYQRPSIDGDSLQVLEIPVTVWRRPIGTLSYWKGLLPVRLLGGPHVFRPSLKGWFLPNVWGNPLRFAVGITDVISRAKLRGKTHYASYLHPGDVQDNYENLRRNLEYVIRIAERSNIELEFTTATQAYGELHETARVKPDR